jgi:cobalt-zinc-cadmium resistance protein CzcA
MKAQMNREYRICLLMTFVILLEELPLLDLKGQELTLSLNQLLDSAMANRAELKISGIQIEANNYAIPIKEFENTEISYRSGYLYSLTQQNEWNIRQDFAFPLKWSINKRLQESNKQLEMSKTELLRKQITAEVKIAYFTCLYQYIYYQRMQYVMGILSKIVNSLNKDSLDNEIMTRINEWSIKADDSYYNLLDAQNDLKYAACLSVDPLPGDTVLELYQIIPASDTSTRTPARLFQAIHQSEARQQNDKIKLSQTNFYPSLYIGYSIRQEVDNSNHSAWQVGIKLPLFWKNNSNEYKKCQLERNEIELEWIKQKAEIDRTTEKLIIQMNKYFSKINHLRNFILPNIDREEYSLANNLFENNFIAVTELESFFNVQNFYFEYYNSVYQYNINAVELEIYAY